MVLFNTVSNIVTPASPAVPMSSDIDCENLKKKSLILEITFLCQLSISAPAQLVILDHFILVSLPELTNPVGSVKVCCCCCLDILPVSMFKDVFRSIGPHIVNSSLASSQVPIYFKNAVIHPILKKPH